MSSVDTQPSRNASLTTGWDALARTDWVEARRWFEEAVAKDPSPEALEGLSLAAWWLDDADTMFQTRERAYRLYRERGDLRSAARLATLLGIDYYQFRAEPAVGNGWFRRAHRLLADLPPVPEHGWLAIWEGQVTLLVGKDSATGRKLGAEAAELGRSLGLVDLEMTGLALEGLALVTEGDIEAGMPRLDEATAAALGGEMTDPTAIGTSCCYLIYACERVWDFDRAVQWCRKVQQFCEEWRWAALFAVCRVHHAAVLVWQGDWAKAEAELEAATRELEVKRPGKVADALIHLAELRRRQGRLEEATQLLQPVKLHLRALLGLASLAIDRADPAEALDLLDRFLRRTPSGDRSGRAAALELIVRGNAALGRSDEARAALSELQAITEDVGTEPIRASATFAEGVLIAAEGDHTAARRCLEDAVHRFELSGGPYETARARLELATSLTALDRVEAAGDEARTALAALRELGARREAERAQRLLDLLSGAARRRSPLPALTPRETEVLRLVAEGLTNARIAEHLVVSEHTVHRHVANILRKLDLPSRTAAAAHAVRLGLLDASHT